jgi:acyl-CoA dehydrogenase
VADGPTAVHQTTIARQVLRGYQPADGRWPSEYIPARRAEAAAELLGEKSET